MTAGRAAFTLVVAAALLLGLAPGAVQAQDGAPTEPALRRWRPVISVAAAWLGSQDLGRVDATMRPAAVGPATAAPFTLFATDSTLGGSGGGELSMAVPISRRWAVSLRAAASRPTLTTAISADAEGAPNVAATERVSDYVIDVALLYQLPRVGGRRVRSYLTAGGGYLRQLHADNVLVDTGRTWHGGAGLRWWLRGGSGRIRPVGVTGELRWVWRTAGIAFTEGARSAPAAAVGMFVGF